MPSTASSSIWRRDCVSKMVPSRKSTTSSSSGGRSLKRLHLSCRDLTEIPPGVFEMTDLTRLDLSWNHIRVIPPEIKKLTRLEELWINANPLEAIPPEIQHCVKLKVLDARYVDVRSPRVPFRFATLTHARPSKTTAIVLKRLQRYKSENASERVGANTIHRRNRRER